MRRFTLTTCHTRGLRGLPFIVIDLINYSGPPNVHVWSNNPTPVRKVRMMNRVTAPRQVMSRQNTRAPTYVIDTAMAPITRGIIVVADPRR